MHTDASRFYEILELDHSASDRAIRVAFRRRAKVLHPDAPTGDAEAFILLKRAYDTLSGRDSRADYDRACQPVTPGAAYRRGPLPHRAPPPPPGPPPMPPLQRGSRGRGGIGFGRYVIAFIIMAALSIGGVQAMIFLTAAPPSIRLRDAGAGSTASSSTPTAEPAAPAASPLPGSTRSGFWDPAPASKN